MAVVDLVRDAVKAPYSVGEALDTILAVQALLLAGSTLAATIGSQHKLQFGRKTRTPAQIALGIFGLMVISAAGGVVAWWTIFVTHGFADSFSGAFEGAGLIAPLLIIPLLGWFSTRWAAPSDQNRPGG